MGLGYGDRRLLAMVPFQQTHKASEPSVQRSPQRRMVRGTKQPCLTYLELFGEDESLDINQDDDTSGFEKKTHIQS